MRRSFRGLSTKQQEVFEAIVNNQQEGHPTRTLQWLEQKGLIVRRYEVPAQWLREWKEWTEKGG
jgi:hypothetical protein